MAKVLTRDGFYYLHCQDDTVTILRTKGRQSHFYIPTSIGGLPVKKIADEAFINDPDLKTVYISEGVEEIGDRAFYGCNKMELCVLPESVKRIGLDSFKRIGSAAHPDRNDRTLDRSTYCYTAVVCSNEQARMLIKEGGILPRWLQLRGGNDLMLTKRGNFGLYIGEAYNGGCSVVKCTGLQPKTLSLPAEFCGHPIVEIEKQAFFHCHSFKKVIIPEGIKMIGEEAFCSCRCLKEVTLPKSIHTIGKSAFYKAWSLSLIFFKPGVKIIDDYAFDGSGLKMLRLPDKIEYIGKYAFAHCTMLRGIHLPQDLKHIEEGTFFECRSLSRILIPGGTEVIGRFAFSGCVDLQSALFPNGIRKIGEKSFEYCRSLKNIILPESVEKVGYGAFSKCGELSDITIVGTPSELPASAFYDIAPLVTFHCYSTETAQIIEGFRNELRSQIIIDIIE